MKMKNEKFDVGKWYIKKGFFILTAIYIIIFFSIWIFFMTPDQKKEMQSNQCFGNYDCKHCVYQSFCKEINLNLNQVVLGDKIICSDDFQNLTSIDFTFTILNKRGLIERYPDCNNGHK